MLIGIVGFAGSGKDTIGNILVSDFNFRKLSFASKLKDVVSILFNWPRHLLEGDTEESRIFRETPDEFWSCIFQREISPRYMLQYFGTDVCQNHLYLNIWVDSLLLGISDTDDVVISDVRFLNEIEAIKKRNGIIIRVKRNDDPIWFNNLKQSNESERKRLYNQIGLHISELDWIRKNVWQYEIENYSNLNSLRENVRMLMSNLK